MQPQDADASYMHACTVTIVMHAYTYPVKKYMVNNNELLPKINLKLGIFNIWFSGLWTMCYNIKP